MITVPGRIGSYYYGWADFLYAKLLLRAYPQNSAFWQQFDVIHINQIMGPALRKLKECNVPVLFLIHHPVTADREIAIEESSFIEGLLWRAKYALLVSWQGAMCSIADRVVTVSKTMQSRISQDYQCDRKKIHVVPNGVDGNVFTFVPSEVCTADVIAVGSFVHPRKGFRYLVDVYRRLSQHNLHIVDVGRRTDEQLKAIEDIPGVTVYGTVDAEQLIYLVQHSRCLVSTSLFEGFGLSLIEALSCGHPAFAFDVGAVPEVLGSIDSSFVAPQKDTEALSSKILKYLQSSVDGREEQYRKAVLEAYSIISSADSLCEMYRKMANKSE